MSIESLMKEVGAKVADDGDSHYKHGWVHIDCPHCGDGNFHLGFAEGAYSGRCFVCGRHSLWDTLRKFGARNIQTLMKEHLVMSIAPKRRDAPDRLQKADWPPYSCERPMESHVRYLKKRKFDLDLAMRVFQCRFGPDSLVVPVFDEEHRMVGWQKRNVKTSDARHKTSFGLRTDLLLYGLSLVPMDRKKILVVEGVMDAWRFGAGNAVATFGIDWSQTHLKKLADNFEELWIVYDSEDRAQRRARGLADALRILGREATTMDLWDTADDPGEMDDMKARFIVEKTVSG